MPLNSAASPIIFSFGWPFEAQNTNNTPFAHSRVFFSKLHCANTVRVKGRRGYRLKLVKQNMSRSVLLVLQAPPTLQ